MRMKLVLVLAAVLAFAACSDAPPPPSNFDESMGNGLATSDDQLNQMMSDSMNGAIVMAAVTNVEDATGPTGNGQIGSGH